MISAFVSAYGTGLGPPGFRSAATGLIFLHCCCSGRDRGLRRRGIIAHEPAPIPVSRDRPMSWRP